MKKLSRDEMKKVIGGMNAPGGACAEDHTWLVCSTPNGTESWCRSSSSGNASNVCQSIYPAYGGSVSGNWAPVVIVP